MMRSQTIPIASVRVPAKRKRTLEATKVEEIASDMHENGQTTPIQVRADGDGFILVEGYHRLEALRALGEDEIASYLVQARKF